MRRAVILPLAVLAVIAIFVGCNRNRPTTPSVPTGPDTGWVGVTHIFHTTSQDRQGFSVECRFDWGDGQVSDWMPYDRSQPFRHSWSAPGTYRVRAQARDHYNNRTTPWSPALTVPVVDTAGRYWCGRVCATIQLDAFIGAIAVSRDGRFLYVTNPDSHTVTVVSTSDFATVRKIPVGWVPWALAVSQDNVHLYIANLGSRDISVINTTTNSEVRRIPLPIPPEYLAVCNGGTRLFVGSRESDWVKVLALPGDSVLTDMFIPGGVKAIAAYDEGPYDPRRCSYHVCIAGRGHDAYLFDGQTGTTRPVHLPGTVFALTAIGFTQGNYNDYDFLAVCWTGREHRAAFVRGQAPGGFPLPGKHITYADGPLIVDRGSGELLMLARRRDGYGRQWWEPTPVTVVSLGSAPTAVASTPGGYIFVATEQNTIAVIR